MITFIETKNSCATNTFLYTKERIFLNEIMTQKNTHDKIAVEYHSRFVFLLDENELKWNSEEIIGRKFFPIRSSLLSSLIVGALFESFSDCFFLEKCLCFNRYAIRLNTFFTREQSKVFLQKPFCE